MNKKVAYGDSPMFHAPHCAEVVLAEEWDRVYSRQQAAFPAPWTASGLVPKHWPTVRS